MSSKYHLPSKVKMIIVFVNLFGAVMMTPQSSQGEDSNRVVGKTGEISFEERLTSMQHMSKLGTAITIYADCNKGKYPKHLDEFESYSGIHLDWIFKNVCYIGAKLTKEAPPDKPIAFDKTMLSKGDGTVVLFNSMLVEFVRPDKLEKLRILKGECISDKDQTTDNKKQKEKKGQIDLKVIGPDGETLSSAKVYQRYKDYDGQRSGRTEYTCDTNGLVNLVEDEVFKYEKERKGTVLYGLYKDKLAGIVNISTDDLGKEVILKLTPACRVFGKITSTELNDLGQKVGWTNIYVTLERKHLLSCARKQGNYEILLPSGKYNFMAYGNHLYPKHEQVEVTSEQKELEKNYDLPADRLAYLIGKEAPELQKIKGWTNSEELKLANLRGKVVLLDFWGTWCGPCVGAIPKLIDLHEKYHDKGLVIIGIHDDSMNSIEELKKKVAQLSEERWEGRKIPFAIALDGGGSTPIEGIERTARGATTAAYGIQSWPTMVLIDKEGRVVKEYNHEANTETLEKLLAMGVDNTESARGKQIVLKVVGPNEEALSGVKVYQDYSVRDERQYGKEYICNNDGLISLSEDELFQYEWKRKKGIVLYGLYENKLAGFVDVNASDLDKELTVKLTPVRRVFGKIKSTELNDLGQKVSWTYVDVYYKNRQMLSCSSDKGKFEIFLPNGKYKLYVGGTKLYSKQEEVEIKAGQKKLEINFDLLADRLAHLTGKEAPELQQIKGWINSEEIKLADLRGKVVLLDFWGTWCGPCVADILALIDLHEKYHDKGLVIIGIHDDSMNSIEELEKKIERLTEERWEGKKIPFAIVLDGGGECKIEGTKLTARGATTAAYGIQGWPTLVLIDKKGKVVKEFSKPSFSMRGGKVDEYFWDDAEVLEKLLGMGVDKRP